MHVGGLKRGVAKLKVGVVFFSIKMADEMVENIPLDIPRTVAIKGGRVIDPATNIDEVMDVILIDGKISAVGRDINPPDGSSVFNATGYIVCPGLIDLHVHCFPDGSILGIDPDIYCLSRGVTTVVDAGSAGITYWGCGSLYYSSCSSFTFYYIFNDIYVTIDYFSFLFLYRS